MGKSKVGKEVMYLTKSVKPHFTDQQIKKMRADYIETQNLRETARRNKCSYTTVKKYVELDDDFGQKLTQKLEQNSKDFLTYMESKNEDIQRLLTKLLHGMEVRADELDEDGASLKDLAMAFGIVMDKRLKMVELSRGNANNEQITKVRELLDKLEDEANK